MEEATTTVTISVTQQHIDEGARGNCRFCAVALAICDAVPGSEPAVGPSSIVLGMTPVLSIRTPQIVKQFIRDFDEGRPVNPISFPLEVSTDLIAEWARQAVAG